jgi:hypothetical protein
MSLADCVATHPWPLSNDAAVLARMEQRLPTLLSVIAGKPAQVSALNAQATAVHAGRVL